MKTIKPLLTLLVYVLVISNVYAESTFTLNLKNTDIRTFIGSVAKKTGKNFVIDPRVKAKVNVISSKAINSKELYEVFLSVLQVYGYATISNNNITKIVPDTSAKQGSIPVYKNKSKGYDQIVTKVIKVDNIPAAELVPILRPLVPQEAHLVAYSATNALILTDREANINRMEAIIKKVDIADNQEIEILSLVHASASEVVRIINSLNRKNVKGKATDKLVLAADNRTNSVLISGDKPNRLRVRVLINHLDTPLKRNSGNTKVVYLRYASAEELATLLKDVSDSKNKSNRNRNKGSSSLGDVDIRAHETTNALVITASPAEMQNIQEIIRKLDIRRAQVLVEAIIAEVKEDETRELGVQVVSKGTNGTVAGITNFASGSSSNILSLASDPPSIGSGLSLGLTNNAQDFGALARALLSDASTNILSTPSIVTLDNQEAKIVVGQNAPIVTGSYATTGSNTSVNNPFQTIERKDIGLTLKVKPQINEGNTIKMEIAQEVSSIAVNSQTTGLTTNTRTIDTVVLVEDGQTLVLGGLMDDIIQEKTESIPFFGDIPLIGSLFSYQTSSKVKQNLMVFIHPTILRDLTTENLSTSQKYSYMRALELQISDKESSLLDDNTLVLPEIPILDKKESKLIDNED